MGDFIYSIRAGMYFEEADKKLLEHGFIYLPEEISGTDTIYFRPIELNENDYLIEQLTFLFNDKQWQKINKISNKKSRQQFEDAGIRFAGNKTSGYRVIQDEKFYNRICGTWSIQFNANSDNAFCLTNEFIDVAYFNSEVLDKYCTNIIKELVDDKVIEKVQVGEENENFALEA